MRNLAENYRKAKAHIEQHANRTEAEQDQLLFAHGFLMGAELYGAAAAVERIYRRTYPGAGFPLFFEGET
jgi:hypothetical protein